MQDNRMNLHGPADAMLPTRTLEEVADDRVLIFRAFPEFSTHTASVQTDPTRSMIMENRKQNKTVPDRRIMDRLGPLTEEAENVIGHSHHNNPNSLLGALNFLVDLEDRVVRELDYAIITLREQWRYSPKAIARALGTRWDVDRSDQIIQMPDNELGVKGGVVRRRYVQALERQFGTNAITPDDELFEILREDIRRRSKIIRGEPSPLPSSWTDLPLPVRRRTVGSDLVQRVLHLLKKRGNIPAGLSLAYRHPGDEVAGEVLLNIDSDDDRTVAKISIDNPEHLDHPFRGIDSLIKQIEHRARGLASETSLDAET